MLILSNGIRVMLDHVTWYSLRHDEIKNRYLLQFGYAGGDKTFVAFTDEPEAKRELQRADDAMDKWVLS
jgi:hypothetical protein